MRERRRLDGVLAAALLRDSTAADFHLRPLSHDANFGRLQHDFFGGGQHDALGGSHFDIIAMRLQLNLAAGGDELDTEPVRKQADTFRYARQQFPADRKLGIADAEQIDVRLRADRNIFLAVHGNARRRGQGDHWLAARALFLLPQVADQLGEFLVVGTVGMMR